MKEFKTSVYANLYRCITDYEIEKGNKENAQFYFKKAIEISNAYYNTWPETEITLSQSEIDNLFNKYKNKSTEINKALFLANTELVKGMEYTKAMLFLTEKYYAVDELADLLFELAGKEQYIAPNVYKDAPDDNSSFNRSLSLFKPMKKADSIENLSPKFKKWLTNKFAIETRTKHVRNITRAYYVMLDFDAGYKFSDIEKIRKSSLLTTIQRYLNKNKDEYMLKIIANYK
jgi:hypothetical protein